jgi:hypothetical protein
MNLTNKEKETFLCISYFYWEKLFYVCYEYQYSIFLLYVFIVTSSCYVNIVLFYIESVFLDATSTTPVDVAPVVKG